MKRAILYFVCLLGWTSCNNLSSGREALDSTKETKSLKNKTVPADTTVDVQFNYNALDSSAAKAWLLVPDKSAGLTHLNEDAEKVYQRFGSPDGGDAAMQKAVAIWYTNHDSTEHSTAIYIAREPGVDPIARVEQIRITSPSFQTAEGIHTGSALKEIEATYPVQKSETYTDAGMQYRVYDSKKGIAFEIGPDGGCVAIIIHQAGVINEGTYLKFRTTNKFIVGRKA